MMVWPALTLLGFLVLTALVIAMGTNDWVGGVPLGQFTDNGSTTLRGAARPRSRWWTASTGARRRSARRCG